MNSLIIDGRTAGLFSNLLHTIDNIKYCELYGYKPIIRWSDVIYTDGRNDIWNQYFESINDGIIEGQSEYSNMFKLKNYILDDGLKSILYNIRESDTDDRTHRHDVHKIFDRYIIPVEKIRKQVDDFIEKNFTSDMLGVHVRGTDYGFDDFDSYFRNIDNNLEKHNMIYLATDNEETIDKIKKRYGEKMCFFETERMKKYKDPVLCYTIKDKIKHAEDVITEVYLLSKCNHLICINSNVPLTSLYINNNMSFDLIYRSKYGA